MTTAERFAIHQAGERGDAAFMPPADVSLDALAVCEQVVATFHHADGCGPAYYQMALDVINRVKAPK